MANAAGGHGRTPKAQSYGRPSLLRPHAVAGRLVTPTRRPRRPIATAGVTAGEGFVPHAEAVTTTQACAESLSRERGFAQSSARATFAEAPVFTATALANEAALGLSRTGRAAKARRGRCQTYLANAALALTTTVGGLFQTSGAMAGETEAHVRARTGTASLFRSSCRVYTTEARPAIIRRQTSGRAAGATAARRSLTRTTAAPGKPPVICRHAEPRAAAARLLPRIAARPITSPKRTDKKITQQVIKPRICRAYKSLPERRGKQTDTLIYHFTALRPLFRLSGRLSGGEGRFALESLPERQLWRITNRFRFSRNISYATGNRS